MAHQAFVSTLTRESGGLRVSAWAWYNNAMETVERQQLERWVRQWQAAAPRLAELRRRELMQADTKQSLLNLADAFEACRLNCRPVPTSGLVAQQALFRRLRS